MKPPLRASSIQSFLGEKSPCRDTLRMRGDLLIKNPGTVFGTAIAIFSWSMKKVLKQEEEKKVVQALFSEWSRKTYKKLRLLF